MKFVSVFLICILSCVACKLKPYVPDFPKIDPQLHRTVFFEPDGIICMEMCFDINTGHALAASECGVEGKDNQVNWPVDHWECDGLAGFHTQVWAEKIIP